MVAERNLHRRRDRLDAKRLSIGMIKTRDRIKVSFWQFELSSRFAAHRGALQGHVARAQRSSRLGSVWPGAVGQAARKGSEPGLADRGRGAADCHLQAR